MKLRLLGNGRGGSRSASSSSVALFSVYGFVAPFMPVAPWTTQMVGGLLLAAICGNAQGLANCMAANARRAKARGDGFQGTYAACVICFLGFGSISAFGLHNGWELVKASGGGHAFPPDVIMAALFLFAAFSEPAMNWVVEAIKQLARIEQVETPARAPSNRKLTVVGGEKPTARRPAMAAGSR